MTRAAERLHLTQSALSHQLREIEGRIGIAFFTRLGRRMVLTAAGRRVLETARRVIADLQRTEEDLRRLAGHTDGSIRVCTECNTGYHWLAPLLTSFRRKHPRVSVHVAAEATEAPLAALLDGRVDLAILIDPRPDKRLRLRPLFDDEMVAIVARTDALARRRWLDAADLAAQHLLLYSSNREDSFVFRRLLRPAGLTPDRVSFIMLTEAMIELARAGTGVAILPRWSAQRALASGGIAALPLTRRGMRRRWVAATLATQPEPPYLGDFLDLLADRALPARPVRDTA
jgi:LysR family transcriptional regulator for metE and metH